MVTLTISLEEHRYLLNLLKKKEEDNHWSRQRVSPDETLLLSRLIKHIEEG